MEIPELVVNRWNGRPYSQRYYDLLEKRRTLPVWQIKELLVQVLKDNQILIVVGDNCGGKTTQIPQFVLPSSIIHHDHEQNKMMVACTQLRPMSVKSVAHRVAEEMDVTIGEEVGYSIPLEEDCTSCDDKTVLKYLTDDMLLREAMTTDPLFKRYNVIIVDQAQERTLATDILVAYLRQFVMKHRPDLKLVVMCNTTNAAVQFSIYFPDSPLMTVPEKHHPVEILYTKELREGDDYLEDAIITVLMIHLCEQGPGDVLVFLAQEEDIEHVCQGIIKQLEGSPDIIGTLKVVPLYSTSPPAMLQKIYDPAPRSMEGLPPGRKIVVTTDIAETSLTMDDIVYVVDTGYAKRKFYNDRRHSEFMRVLPISKASANQRAKHAGRTQPGKCFRLYTEMSFNGFENQHTNPEILRSNLANTVLTLKKLRIDDLVHFEFLDPPAPETLIRAQLVLKCLGALDDKGNLTTLGEIMSEFPLDPQMSKMLIVSPGFNCSNEILTISAMLSVPDCFVRPMGSEQAADEAKARLSHIDGDHIRLLNVYNAYKKNNEDPSWCNNNFVNARLLESADSLRQQLMCIMSRFQLKLCSTDVNNHDYYVNIRKAMLVGYFMQVAYLDRSGHYLTVKDNLKVTLHPSNCLDHKPQWVIYNEYVMTSRNSIRTVTAVHGEWLVEIAPHYYDIEKFPQCEAKHVLEWFHKMVI